MENDEIDVDIHTCARRDLLPVLFRLQNQRCITYQRLADAQLMFFNSHNLPAFQRFLADITMIFARISQEIIRIRKRFEEQSEMKTIVKHVGQLQDFEEEKLRVTNDLFVAKIEKKNEEINDGNRKLNELIENINDILDELRYDQEELILAESSS